MGEGFNPLDLLKRLGIRAEPPLAPENDPSRSAGNKASERRKRQNQRKADAAVEVEVSRSLAESKRAEASPEQAEAAARGQARTTRDRTARQGEQAEARRTGKPRPKDVTQGSRPIPGSGPTRVPPLLTLPGSRGIGSRVGSGVAGVARRAAQPIGGKGGPLGQFSPLDLATFGLTTAGPLLLGGEKPKAPQLPAATGTASRAGAEAAERERRRRRGRGRQSTRLTTGRSLGTANTGATTLLGR